MFPPKPQISWIRHRDVHVLSVGSDTFTSDRRFRSLFLEDEGRLSLTIRGVEAADEGGYECQVRCSRFELIHTETQYELYSEVWKMFSQSPTH